MTSDFICQLKERFMPAGNDERIVSVILDGENAWGSYQQAGRPFFDALYGMLGFDPQICTVTFSEFLEGNPGRGVRDHPVQEQERVCKLAHASWIDEYHSRPGNDLGTWIGEPEENAAWDLRRETRELFKRERITPETHPQAFEALYAAEGSDWFWW
jgi:alpha-amylase/alpha-mannosidase (GH57 family)